MNLDEVTTENSGENLNIKRKEDLTKYFKATDPTVNHLYQSKIPKICKDEPCILGVDEAGRGPVLGPMVYGIAYIPSSKKDLLVKLRCADSKILTEEKRDDIFDDICKHSETMGWAIESLSPEFISRNMYKRCKISLNEVAMNSTVKLIRKTLDDGVRVTEVFVDTIGKPEKYQAYLKSLFPELNIKVEKKADATYPIVSAASICAKVSRDHALNAWEFVEGEFDAKYGSGYPNDPATKEWLKKVIDPVFGYPRLVRFSWSTCSKLLEEEVQVEFEDDEEDEITEDQKNAPKITLFFQSSAAEKKPTTPIEERPTIHPIKHRFFAERNLCRPYF